MKVLFSLFFILTTLFAIPLQAHCEDDLGDSCDPSPCECDCDSSG